MPHREPLGILSIDSLHFYTRDIRRLQHALVNFLDFSEIGESSQHLIRSGHQRSKVFEAGNARILASEPVGEGGRAWRYLKKHPDGVGTIAFNVEDIQKTWRLIEERGGTPITEIQRFEDEGGTLATFSITSAFGDCTLRFFERNGYTHLYPDIPRYDAPKGGQNRFAFTRFDHITSNFETMKPALLWMEHVLGFEPYWDVEFHTTDIDPNKETGSGLKSQVMWDPYSKIAFANNEPQLPYFKRSQINVFAEENRGPGVQHAALLTEDILTSVQGLRKQNVPFMPTPWTYYEALPERIRQLGVMEIDESIHALQELEILVDGNGPRSYMLQIFLKEFATIFETPDAGPFFFEIIQRKGDRGFGAGNFRALFESIERQQHLEGKI